MTIPKPKITV